MALFFFRFVVLLTRLILITLEDDLRRVVCTPTTGAVFGGYGGTGDLNK